MFLYPQAPKPAGVPLDSVADARARMLIRLEMGCSGAEAISFGLNGSDDVAAVAVILDEILDERAELESIPLDNEAPYTAAVEAQTKYLDAAKWVAGKKAQQGGTLAPQVGEV